MTHQNVSAQELLDGLRDHEIEFTQNLNRMSSSTYSRRDPETDEIIPHQRVATWVIEGIGEDHELTNGLLLGLQILDREAMDRLSLAKAKIAASGSVGEKEMTTSEMEHLRKLLPSYISFLQTYISVLKKCETVQEAKLQDIRASGNTMAKEALASLGSAKQAGDAPAFVRSIQEGHARDNQYQLVTQSNAERRANDKLDELDDLLGLLDSAKTNANSAIVAPFPDVSPLRVPEDGEAKKSVQQILCESSPGPASYYAKLNKLRAGLCLSTDGGAGKYVIAGIKGPGLRDPVMARFDVLQRYNDWFYQLIKYRTAMDRFNLQVRMTCGDSCVRTMSEELIRWSQSPRRQNLLQTCEIQIRCAKSTVKENHRNIESSEKLNRLDLIARQKREKTKFRSGAPEGEDASMKTAREALEQAHRTSMETKHQKQRDELESELRENRRTQWLTLKMVDGIEDSLTQARADLDANNKVNARRRAPANSQTWVACVDI